MRVERTRFSFCLPALVGLTLAGGCGTDDEPSSEPDPVEDAAAECKSVSSFKTAVPKSPSASETQVVEIAPVDRSNCPREDLMIKDFEGVGGCERGSRFVGGKRALRCGVGNSSLDPCWTDASQPTTAVCLFHPWETNATRVKTRRELPLDGRPSSSRRYPWGVQLSDGQRCFLLAGAHSVYRGRAIDYYCGSSRGGTRLLRGVDREGGTWRLDAVEQDGARYFNPRPVDVTVAWFGA